MALDPEAASAILDDADDHNDDTDPKIDEYGAAIPSEPFMLHANGDIYDLRDSDQVNDLQEQIKSDRNDLQIGELPKYEGHSTDWGGGGRARLLYDQVRVDLAQEYHEGRHHMSWTQQHQDAMKVVRIVAVKNRNMY
jgi:hypothetical protein